MAYEDVTIAVVVIGFLMTLGTTIVAVTRGIDKAGRESDRRIVEAIELSRKENETVADKLEATFSAAQKEQEQRFGEVGHALRTQIGIVENKVYQLEIWVRDHLVDKEDIRAFIKRDPARYDVMIAEIAKDVRHLLENFDLHMESYRSLSDQVIRLEKDIERIDKLFINPHH